MSVIPHLINGELVTENGRAVDVFNPSTGQAIHKLPLATRETIQSAIDAAKAAFPAWRNTPPAKRAQVMFRFKQLLEQNEARISQLISEEHGKTLEDAAGELKRGIENVEFACAAPEILKGEYSRGCRYHAVQLPGHGAVVDVPAGDRLRQLLHPQAIRA
jgi:malonate-semialdehyde dehydrogenase (acetylating)/methylmalonate-semialdehyde dehydrogenase